MASPAESAAMASPAESAAVEAVDPFLKEALENPRHRLTVLRMELDVQKFINSESAQFEFPYFPTSYIRLAAHRVAQHYGLHSIALDNGNRIVIQKTLESKYPLVCLSQIVIKQSEHSKVEPFKIAIRPRLERASSSDLSEIGVKRSAERSVEEREEEYEKARARIFNVSSSGEQEGPSSPTDGRRSPSFTGEGGSCSANTIDAIERTSFRNSGNAFRVAAIFKDREKDRSDPDYDRSYDRFVKTRSAYSTYSSSGPFTMLQPSYVPYEASHCQLGQLPNPQSSVNYGLNPLSSSFPSPGSAHTGGDTLYVNWPSPTMVYAQSYEHLRHGVFQVPFYQQQPLSFDHLHNR